jgi:hypothetical protein
MSKNQFPWQDTLAQRVTENLIDVKGDGVYVYDNVICGLDYDNAHEFLEDVMNSCGRHDPDKPYSLYSPDLPELRKTLLPALGALLTIDNVYSAPLWDCSVVPITEVGEVFWIGEAKPRVREKTQLTPLSDAVTKLYNETMQAFEHVLRNEKRAWQNYTTDLRSSLHRVLQNTKDRCNTNPEDARRLCRQIVNLLTRDSVEVPRQQGTPELSEALERVVNLLKSPNDTQWTQDEYQAVKSGLVPTEKPPIGLD